MEELEKVARECRKLGSEALAVATDVTVEGDCEKLMARAASTFGCIDILVLNAGVGCHNVFADTTQSDVYHKSMQVNFFGYLYCTKHAFPYLAGTNQPANAQRSSSASRVEQSSMASSATLPLSSSSSSGVSSSLPVSSSSSSALASPRGLIVVVSSLSGEIGLPYRTAYCASKYAVTGFFESLRCELDTHSTHTKRPPPIDISIVCPPSVQTSLREHSLTPKDGAPPPIATRPDQSAISAQQCAMVVVEAADRRLRKVYFPLKAYLGVYARPFVPDLVDYFAKKAAKL